jgi:hypothetical protein
MTQALYSHLYTLESTASTASAKRSRSRGVILSQQGWYKLNQAEVLCDKWGNRYSYEYLAGRSLLDTRTVSRILSCEVKVDKRTLKIFFQAFSLHLNVDDYTAPESSPAAQPITSFTQPLNSSVSSIELNFSYGELLELYQLLMKDFRQLSNFLNSDKMGKDNRFQSINLNPQSHSQPPSTESLFRKLRSVNDKRPNHLVSIVGLQPDDGLEHESVA